VIDFSPDFRDLLTYLNDANVEYLVVGGYAVNYFAEPRVTADIDLWFGDSDDNLRQLAQALRRFGFSERILSAPLFAKPTDILRFGAPPNLVDMFLQIAGVNFADCYSRRTIAQIESLDIPIIGLNDLRANKRAAGRPKDLADLDKLPK
jgi:hypothetical protein